MNKNMAAAEIAKILEEAIRQAKEKQKELERVLSELQKGTS